MRGDKQQVNIGTVVEFLGSMLAQGDDDKIVCADSALLAGKVETGAHESTGKFGELPCDGSQIIQGKQITGANTQDLTTLVTA